MLQHKRVFRTSTTAENYWQIADYSTWDLSKKELVEWLKNRNVQVVASKFTKARLLTCLDRAQRDLYQYDTCSRQELRTFCNQRRLPTPATNKDALIKILEAADETATFDKFMDLPAELRVMIYELHFNWLTLHTVRQDHHEGASFIPQLQPPPITHISKPLQAEALPVFYKTLIFELSLSWPYTPESSPDTILRAVPGMKFGETRILFLVVRGSNPKSDSKSHLRLQISQPWGGEEIRWQIKRYEPNSYLWPNRHNLEWRLGHLMKVIRGRAAPGRLREEDVRKIFSFFPSA